MVLMENSNFTVIIVGGSIAGLTLAHCLERAKINHVILEKSSDIAPQVGASIGILPNGARILDQLGIYDEIKQHIEPLEKAIVCYPDGFNFGSSYPQRVHEKFGYPIAFLARQKLLEILYWRYSSSKRIHLNSNITSIRSTKSGISVATADGMTYRGHLVVGADGVHSQVRATMWDEADNAYHSLIQQEKQSMTVEYSCIFGISSPISGLTIGEQINAFFNHLTIVTIHGKKGRVFWFVIQKLTKKYIYPHGPRFTLDDAASTVAELRHIRVYKGVTFGQIWENREVASMTALEENVFRMWYGRRIVLIGDSIHKMTPNIGQGANMAIEDAAVLATLLQQLHHSQNGHGPTLCQMEGLFQQYQRVRYDRVRSIYSTSRFLVRLQARDGILNRFFGRYYVPYAGDLPAEIASQAIANGEVCEFLPLTSSKDGWNQYRHRGWITNLRTLWMIFVVPLISLLMGLRPPH